MLQLNYNIANAIAEYDLIVDSKESPSLELLQGLKAQVEEKYELYLEDFDNIHTINDNSFDEDNSKELENCYNNPTNALENLKLRLTEAQTDEFKVICPYCLMINHSTFDHYIPKKNHPAFSVLPKNLIPCCDKCNKKKHQYWLAEDGERGIIHFYNDNVNNEKFLYCDLTSKNTILKLNFRLSFRNNIDPSLRGRIENHFDRLKLINRYNKNPLPISDISTDIKSNLSIFDATELQIANLLRRKAAEFYMRYGNNYWYAVAYEAVANSPASITNLVNKAKA